MSVPYLPAALCVASLLSPADPGGFPGAEGVFVRGDSDADGRVDLSDAVAILGHLFLGSFESRCHDALDADDSGAVDLADPISILGFLFLGAPPPAPPFPEPGRDYSLDELICSDSAPPGGQGPVTPEEIEPLLARALDPGGVETTLSAGGIRTSPDIFERLASLGEGEDLLDYVHEPGMNLFIEKLHEHSARTLGSPNLLLAPAGADGCYEIDPQLLRPPAPPGAGSSKVVGIEVDPPVVCAVGPHEVEVTLIGADGTVETSSTLIHVCDGSDPFCGTTIVPTEPVSSSGDQKDAVHCLWVWARAVRPTRLVMSAEGSVYNQSGHLIRRDEGNDVRVTEHPTSLFAKYNGPGPRHALITSRSRSVCSTPGASYAPRGQGQTTVAVNVLCFRNECVVASRPCTAQADVEGYYEATSRVAAWSGEPCRGENTVSARTQEECRLQVGEHTLFNKGLVLERGTEITRGRSFMIDTGLTIGTPITSGSVGVRTGASELVVDRTGRLQGILRAFGDRTGLPVPLRATLVSAGEARLRAAARAGGRAATATEAAAVYLLGTTDCPGASPVFPVGESWARGDALGFLNDLMTTFYSVRLGPLRGPRARP